MLDFDSWREILGALRQNKLRTILTAFSVAWGIFILVILLGSSNGLYNGTLHEFRDDAINSIWVYNGQTSIASGGLQPGRWIRFTNEDYELLKNNVSEIEHITARYYIRGNYLVKYKNNAESFDVRGCHADHKYLEKTLIVSGRFVNDKDVMDRTKVAIISTVIKDELFGRENPIGKFININNVHFKVVGIYEDEGGENELNKIYVPITTAQRTYGGGERINQIMLTLKEGTSLEESQLVANKVKALIAQKHTFDINDERAARVDNRIERFEKINTVLSGLNIFTWIVGIGTLIAGIVGVSNIMFVVVKERTREIGIRKAIGAKPISIITMILKEAILVTIIAGYTGLVVGVGIVELAADHIPTSSYFRNPEVDINGAIMAVIILVMSGAFAGYLPARKAANIPAIEALRAE